MFFCTQNAYGKERWAETVAAAKQAGEEGKTEQSFALLRDALAQAELLGEDDPRLTASLRLLARALIMSRRTVPEAISLLHREQDILTRKLGPNFPGRAFGLFWIGDALAGSGKYEEAERSLKECLRVAPGGTVKNVDYEVMVFPELAVCYSNSGKHKQAEVFLLKQLAHVRKIHGDTAPRDEHRVHYELASCYYNQKRFAQAELEIQTALTMLEGNRWDTKYDLPKDTSLYGLIEQYSGHEDKALELYKSVASMDKQQPESVYPIRYGFYLNFAALQESLKNYEAAKDCLNKALSTNSSEAATIQKSIRRLDQKIKNQKRPD